MGSERLYKIKRKGTSLNLRYEIDGEPMFQPLWISDIMALRPMLGIELIRDETFAPTMPISVYLDATAIGGTARPHDLRGLFIADLS
ncbi:hypothetical protein [Ochrobactrum soli]|uniref:Uncharacterized protein n=1 Tax=Ochrobactrum soli TaxID=2448455 RepID=A0A849KQ09_9HYPH|nr:hypothetical protein [[Ochrobactrum] soli]NNU61727.1 hypothetical protein [[Ochrobactrum] soli]